MSELTDETMAREAWSLNPTEQRETTPKNRTVFMMSKRIFDLFVCILALPVFLMLCAVVYVLNIFWNQGPLFYFQPRMGKDKRKYVIVKFRSMLPIEKAVERGPFDALEEWRITRFGNWMRLTRLDEVPQILNVIMGHMSLVGPRPEIFEFAETYHREMPGYHVRGTVRPGITGYAQVKQGYTDTEEAVREKTMLDTFYVQNMSWSLDLRILFGTVRVIFTSDGAR